MTSKKSPVTKAAKRTAAVGSAIAAAFVPQVCDAAIVTVGGDGGTGSVTLSNLGDTTNLGNVLASSLSYFNFGYGSAYAYLRGGKALGRQAVRSNVSSLGAVGGRNWRFASSGVADGNAVLGSDDNWLPGHFAVNGVNGGADIYGWLQLSLGATAPHSIEIISFTYDDAATDTTAFAKPVGGFSATAVPEPSGFACLALLATGAGGLSWYRRRNEEESSTAA